MPDVFSRGTALYRRTVKRFPPAHRAVYIAGRGACALLGHTTGMRSRDIDPLWFRLSLHLGLYERATVRLLSRLLRPGMTVLDIGAHIGYYTRQFARSVGPRGQVFAFEPHPLTFAALERNTRRFRNVVLTNTAVADSEGEAVLFDSLVESGSASLRFQRERVDSMHRRATADELAPRLIGEAPPEAYDTRTTSLDAFLASRGVHRVDVIKMDIEGAEGSAIRGMSATIERMERMRIVMEFNPGALRSFLSDPAEALAPLRAAGFRIGEILESGEVRSLDRAALERLTDALEASGGYQNLLCEKAGPDA